MYTLLKTLVKQTDKLKTSQVRVVFFHHKKRRCKKYFFTSTEAAKFLNVTAQTLRNWEKSGRVVPKRTPGGLRRYTLHQLRDILSTPKPKIIRFRYKPFLFFLYRFAASLLLQRRKTGFAYSSCISPLTLLHTPHNNHSPPLHRVVYLLKEICLPKLPMRGMYVLAKNSLIGILLLALLFGNITPVFAQEATSSAALAVNQALETPKPLAIPRLAFPYNIAPENIKVTTSFGQIYDDTDLVEKLKETLQGGHQGIDFAVDENTPILAVDEGEIVQSGEGDLGISVKIKHSWGESVYGHLSKTNVQLGQKISKGETVAFSGNTGISTGPHLHLGVKNSLGQFVDPAPYISLNPPVLTEATTSATPAPSEALLSASASASLQQFLDQNQEESSPSAIPQVEDISQDNQFLYNYKFDLSNGTSAHFYDKKTKSISYAIADPGYNYKLRFFLKESSQSAAPKVEKGKIEFQTSIASISALARYTLSENQVKEEFVIEKNPFLENPDIIKDPNFKIPFTVQAQGSMLEQNGQEYIFRSKDANIDWKILPPTVKDNNGKEGTTTLDFDETSSTLTLNVDTNFLKTASYPIIIDPTVVIGNSGTNQSVSPAVTRDIVRTSDGTLHAFIQTAGQTSTCGGSSKSGLLWFNSTDSGSSWTCQGQLSSDTSNYFRSSVVTDSSDHIYVAYAVIDSGANANYDLYYQKLTKGEGSTWTLETAQKILDASASIAYSYANLQIEGTTRLWLAFRYYDGTNYQIPVYYSDGLTASPTWTQSSSNLDTAGTSNTRHQPVMVRFGTKIGVIYADNTNNNYWRFRDDADTLTSWSNQVYVTGTNFWGATHTAIGDSSGRVYMATASGATLSFFYYNGSTWSGAATVSTTYVNNSGITLSSDGTNVWIFYMDYNGFSTNLCGTGGICGRLVYKKGAPPFTANDFSSATAVVSYHGNFDKYWSYVSSVYTDDTTDASNNTSADTQVVTSSDDIAYFGKSEQFDAVSWDLSTAGVGGTATWEYCSAVDVNTACTTWSALSFTAQTSASASNLLADGMAAFTAPADWASAKVNLEDTAYYYIRARATGNYSTTPVGVQVSTLPQILYSSFTEPASNTIYGVWSENTTSPMKVRYASVSVTTTASTATAEISPTVLGYSSITPATANSTQRHIVRTSDGTLHAFINAGTQAACGGAGSSNNYGLNWVYSTDSGSTWTCGGQLSSNISYYFYASAVADSSDNIYVVYSTTGNGSNAAYDIFYRKLTKGSGASWTLEAEQEILSGSSTSGYSYAVMEAEGTTRLWMAVRYFDNTNYQVSVYYSDGLTAAPTWTQSTATLDTAGTNASYHIPVIVRYASKIGVIFNDQTNNNFKWRNRADADGLTTWADVATIGFSGTNGANYSVVGDSSGNVYFANSISSTTAFTYYNGSSWSSSATVASSTNTCCISVTLDNAATPNVYVVYGGETNNFSSQLTSNRKLLYKKGVSPYATANFDSNATTIVSHHGTFDKAWTYISSSYTDETTDAGNNTSADVAMPSGVGDIIYFGKSTTFDALSYDLSTAGVGGQVAWEYYNGSSWMPLSTFSAVSGSTLTADGYVTFVPHSNWATIAINGEETSYYYVRARVTTAYSTAPVATQVANIPQLNYVNLATANQGMYAIWTENAASPTRIRYKTVATFNNNPDAPTSLGGSSMVDGSFGSDSSPDLTFTLADTDGSDTLKYQIQIDDSSDFGSAVVDYTSALAAQGSKTFTVGQAAGSGSYTTGSEGQSLSDGSYYWRVRATDNSNATGSWATANSGSVAFKIDTTAPSGPSSLASSDHTASTWSDDNTITVTWTAATDTGGSGFSGYSYTFDTTTNTTPDTTSDLGAVTTVTSSALSDGSAHYFHIRAVDTVGNWGSAVHLGPFYIDTTAPSLPSSLTSSTHTASTWSNTSQIAISWTASTDTGGSGVAGYSYTFNTSSTTTPDAVSDGSSTSATSSSLSTGNSYYFHVRSIDDVGNASAAVDFGPFYVDTTSPSTPGIPSTTASTTTDTTPTWSWTASTDSNAGLATNAYTTQWSTDSTFASDVSSSTSTTNSFTHSTTLADGTWYFRVKASDSAGNDSSYSSSGSVIIDNTSPNSIDLDSPADNAYTTSERPTFKWKAASTGDALSGLSKYKLHIDNGTGGDIDIDDIPVSRTTDYETSKYLAHYENFGDSDSSNNYISLYTKSSSSWGSGENDGKLREGKRSWQVTAYDGAGNTKSGSRTLYVDYTSPTLSSVKVDFLTEEDKYLLVTTNRPKISGKMTDNLAYSSIKVALEKETYFLGLLISKTSEEVTKSYSNSSNETSLDFSFDLPKEVDFGKYKITITAVDKAGNQSPSTSFQLHLLSEEKARELLAKKDKKDLEKLKEKSQTSLPALEKKAKLRREREAAELEKITQSIVSPIINTANTIASSINSWQPSIVILAQVKDQMTTFLNFTSQQTQSLASIALSNLDQLEKSFTTLNQTAADNLKYLALTGVENISQPIGKISSEFASNLESGTEYLLSQAKSQTESIPHTYQIGKQNIIYDAQLTEAEQDIKNKIIAAQRKNYREVEFLKSQTQQATILVVGTIVNIATYTNLATGVGIGSAKDQAILSQQQTIKQAKEIAQKSQQTIAELEKSSKEVNLTLDLSQKKLKNRLSQSQEESFSSVSEQTNQIIQVVSGFTFQASQASNSTTELIDNAISKAQKRLSLVQNQANKNVSEKIARTDKAIIDTYQSLKRPISQTGDFMYRVRAGADTFVAIVFDDAPTRISGVTIEEIGPDYAIVSWQTNHSAWGKVNYGQDLTYGQEVVLEKREKYHQAKLTGLEKGKRYFFEVMSQNKNYAYDAYYSFETSN